MTRQRTRSTERAEAERRRRERNSQTDWARSPFNLTDAFVSSDTSTSSSDAGGSDCSPSGGE